MEKTKKYLKKEFQPQMFNMTHEDLSDFYLSAFQKDVAIWPLFLFRLVLFCGALATVIASMIIMSQDMEIKHWFIFMTHWGLLFNALATGLACAVSGVKLFTGLDSSISTLVKVYWVSFNSTITIAFFITAFYWTLLSDDDLLADYAFDPVLDIFVHGINSVVMFCLLVTSRQPTRILHFYVPLALGIVYMVFSLLYYFLGGLSPFGTVWIYPMLDWSDPGSTIVLVIISALLMIVLHFVVVSMTLIRDAVTKSCKQSTVLPICEEDNGISRNLYS
ncbi:protein rolling stone-like [Spodoptera litura]|uniref:Protein rolling stone-like n=1 Tax=Spodoptera litura TaxID=69820 RepID=A0A9J7E675_SPOLT|nr:protein rolling stone-like [Spodoptera litura]